MAQDDQLDDQASRPDPFEEIDSDGLFNPALDEPRQPGDYGSPAAAPGDVPGGQLSKADQRTDTDIDPQEVYDEGLTGATDFDAQAEDSDDNRQPERIA